MCGRTKHVSAGRPITPSEAIDCNEILPGLTAGARCARESLPFRRPAVQKAGVNAPVRSTTHSDKVLVCRSMPQ